MSTVLAPQAKANQATPKKPAGSPNRVTAQAVAPTGERLALRFFTPTNPADTAKHEPDADASAVVERGAGGSPSAAPFGVIVEDDLPVAPGQIHRTELLETLSVEIERVANEELAPTGRTSGDCPYLLHWLHYYRERPAAQIERAIQRYAKPERADLNSLRESVLSRVRIAVQAWTRSGGREVQVPEGVAPSGSTDNVESVSSTAEPIRRKRIEEPHAAPPSASDPAAVRARLGTGRPLNGSERSRMERGFGFSLGEVRLHTDGDAARMARDFSARAFAVGNHIAFGTDQYRPGTLAGDALLAHELAHTTQPANLGHAAAEREANRAVATVIRRASDSAGLRYRGSERALDGAVLSHQEAPEQMVPSKGLALRRCGVVESGNFDPNDVDLGYPTWPDAVTRAVSSALADNDAEKAFFYLQGDSVTDAEVARRLRLVPDAKHGNKFLALQYLLTDLPAADYWESQRLLGANPLAGDHALLLSPAGKKLFDDLFALAPTMENPSVVIEAVLKQVRGLGAEDLRQVLLALTRTYSPSYGSRLNYVQAIVKEKGSDAQYRELIRLMHAPGAEAGLDEADPVLAALAEAQGAAIKQGNAVPADEVLALFGTRAREVALTMLRESEAQIVRVLSRTEGRGAPAVQIQFETDKIRESLNDVRKTYLRDKDGKPAPPVTLPSFDQARPALEARARQFGTDSGEETLRREYDRQIQIILHLIAAPMDKMLRDEIARLQREIDEQDRFLRGPHIVQGQNPIGDAFSGPAGAWRRRDAENERIQTALAKMQRFTAQRDYLKKGQQQIESALPLLGGLSDSGLTDLSKIKSPAEFDKIRDAALARILGNVEKVRKDLISGELNIWMIEKVVSRTKVLFGVDEPPSTDAQKAWAAVVDDRVAKEKKDATKVRDFLEILNTAALIVAIGAALFTGGGSLALYAGIAGAGLGLGTAIYDAVDVQGRLNQAEELYGSGLNYETRLSDVPPDWRFLYLAWLSLGINAVLAIFMIKGLPRASASALRGEEAAVEKEVRALAKRLSDRGVAMSEDEIVKATMQALRDEGMVVGALRGTSVYGVKSKVMLVGGPGRSLEKAIDAEVLGVTRLRGATLAKDATAAAAADEIGYTLTVPTKSRGTEVVRINMRTRPTASLAPGPHGADSGPARLLVSRDTTGWKATIEFDQGLEPRDLRFAAGHELDELADLVHRRPTARPGDIARETQAAYFQPGGATRTATGRAVSVPAHDAATAEELKALMNELERLKGVAGTKPAQLIRERQIDALMKEMGLDTPAMLSDRIAALEKAGVDDALIKKLEARAAVNEFQATTPLSAAGASARAVTQMDEKFIEHMIKAEGRGAAFLDQGVSGGHVTAELEAFEKANPEFAFELKQTKPAAGTTFRRYEQWRWKGTGAPPTTKSLRPGGSKFNPANWEASKAPKTTADSLMTLLREGEDAWGSWRSANPTAATSGRSFGRGLAGTNPKAASSSGVEFSGFFDYVHGTSGGPPQWRLTTLFVDASWF